MKKTFTVLLVIFSGHLVGMEKSGSDEKNLHGKFALISLKLSQALRKKKADLDCEVLDRISKDILGIKEYEEEDHRAEFDEAIDSFNDKENPLRAMGGLRAAAILISRLQSTRAYYRLTEEDINNIVDRAHQIARARKRHRRITEADLRQAMRDLDVKSAEDADDESEASSSSSTASSSSSFSSEDSSHRSSGCFVS